MDGITNHVRITVNIIKPLKILANVEKCSVLPLLVHIQPVAFVCHDIKKEGLLLGTGRMIVIYRMSQNMPLTRVNVHRL